MWGGVPGGYRQTINDNLVLILMIETLEGLKNAEAIAKIPASRAVFAASGDLGNFSGFRQGNPDYERAINIVHDAALKANVRLCGPLAWRDRPDFTCFQAGTETAAINRGVAAELGSLKDTQGKPEVGPVRRGKATNERPALAGRKILPMKRLVFALLAACVCRGRLRSRRKGTRSKARGWARGPATRFTATTCCSC